VTFDWHEAANPMTRQSRGELDLGHRRSPMAISHYSSGALLIDADEVRSARLLKKVCRNHRRCVAMCCGHIYLLQNSDVVDQDGKRWK